MHTSISTAPWQQRARALLRNLPRTKYFSKSGLEKKMSVRGSLDVVSTTGVLGWAYAAEDRAKLIVQALLNNAVIGESVANVHRADLAAVGMGDGNCGYKIDFYQEIDERYL